MECGDWSQPFVLQRYLTDSGLERKAATSRRTPEFPLIYAQASGICKLPSHFHILYDHQ
jgi:hypothetical protein